MSKTVETLSYPYKMSCRIYPSTCLAVSPYILVSFTLLYLLSRIDNIFPWKYTIIYTVCTVDMNCVNVYCHRKFWFNYYVGRSNSFELIISVLSYFVSTTSLSVTAQQNFIKLGLLLNFMLCRLQIILGVIPLCHHNSSVIKAVIKT